MQVKRISPERHIFLYVVGICTVLMVLSLAVILYFRSANQRIYRQSMDNQKYMEGVSISKDFISEVLNSQNLFYEYTFSWDEKDLQSYRKSFDKINFIIAYTQGEEILREEYRIFCQIYDLLQEQYQLISKLKESLFAGNPIDQIAEESLYVKNMDLALRRASHRYESNLKMIRQEVASVMKLNSSISEKISWHLLNLFEKGSVRSLAFMQKSLENAESNQRYSLIVGGLTIVIIVLLSVIILQNLYKIRKTKEELENALSEKQDVLDSRHQLLLSVSHDIKAPLNSIVAHLSTDGDVNIRPILDSASHISSLMDNLLDFSMLQSGEMHLNKSNFNLKENCDQVFNIFESLARKKGLQLKMEYLCDCDLRLNADVLKFKQLIINVISNAIKYTVRGEVRVRIWWEQPERDYLVHVEVNDTGVGISQTQLDRLFEPYYRVDEHKHLSNGSGLGLYIVKSFVELFKGDLDMKSVPGKGTRVLLKLSMNPYCPNESSLSPKKILVIEDDAAFRTVVRVVLNRLSHEVEVSDHLLPGDFDYILSDVNLPDFDPLKLLHTYKEIPVVLMTADASYSKEEALKIGFKEVLYKPFSIEDAREIFGGTLLKNESTSMLGDNTQEIQVVVQAFIDTLPSYLKALEESLVQNDIFMARKASHKMLPMFILFKSGAMIPILNQLNSVEDSGAVSYPNWREEVELLIKMIRQQYG